MYHSAEIRWFFPGETPDEFVRWFTAGGFVANEPARTDEYLLMPGSETTGVKLRKGRFEIKAQTQAPALVDYPGGVAGFHDAWVKWSSAAVGLDRVSVTNSDDEWIDVSKRRRLRRFSLNSPDPVEVDQSTGTLERGCQVELATIRLQTGDTVSTWWSLSLEAFGDPARNSDGLERTAHVLFSESPPARLAAESSFSYPALFVRHISRTRR